MKTGFQFQYTNAQNQFQLFDFAVDPGTGLPVGPVLTQTAANTNVQTREEFWVQDQWSPTDQWTLNLGVRYDQIQSFYNEGQISPRLGVTYKLNQSHVFHANYSRLFTPPNVEQIAFTKVNLQGTTAQPDDPTGFNPRAERSNYFEVGSYHALTNWATLELAAYYKRSHFQSDAGQFGTTPMLNFFAFQWGYQMGIDGALKMQITDDFSARGNVAWGRCKANGLQSGQYLLETKEINGHQYGGRRVLRPLAVDDEFGGGGLSVPRADDRVGPDALWFRPADLGERGCVHQLLALPVPYHLQCLSYPRVPSAVGSAKDAGGIRRHQLCSTSSTSIIRAEGVSGSGWPMRGCPVRSFSVRNGSSDEG